MRVRNSPWIVACVLCAFLLALGGCAGQLLDGDTVDAPESSEAPYEVEVREATEPLSPHLETVEIVTPAEGNAPPLVLKVYPKVVQQGDLFAVHIGNVPGDSIPSVYAMGTEWPVFKTRWNEAVSFVGVSYYTEPRVHRIEVTAEPGSGGNTPVYRGTVHVGVGEFESQRLYVDSQLQSLRSPALWEADRVHFARARASSHPRPLWEGAFEIPLEGRLTSSFGLIRYINDVESGRHSGLDIAAPEGTPVRAAASGVATLAMDLNVTGKTVVVDHGLNLFTCYYHLSHIAVEEGDEIRGGEWIGDVGSTGFSTGPHLHLTVSVGSVPVDPDLLFYGDPARLLPGSPKPAEDRARLSQ